MAGKLYDIEETRIVDKIKAKQEGGKKARNPLCFAPLAPLVLGKIDIGATVLDNENQHLG